MYGSQVWHILVILHLRHFYEIWPSILHSAHALEPRPIKLSARERNERHDKGGRFWIQKVEEKVLNKCSKKYLNK